LNDDLQKILSKVKDLQVSQGKDDKLRSSLLTVKQNQELARQTGQVFPRDDYVERAKRFFKLVEMKRTR
jgi:hypothetical protein